MTRQCVQAVLPALPSDVHRCTARRGPGVKLNEVVPAFLNKPGWPGAGVDATCVLRPDEDEVNVHVGAQVFGENGGLFDLSGHVHDPPG
jgi:hypothetical protein